MRLKDNCLIAAAFPTVTDQGQDCIQCSPKCFEGEGSERMKNPVILLILLLYRT